MRRGPAPAEPLGPLPAPAGNRATLAPLANYIEALHRQRPEITLTVVVPELIAAHRWQQPLHNRVAQRLRKMLIHERGIVITSVPFDLSG